MKDLNITINKAYVFDAVDETTAYIGAKSTEEGAYNRIFTTDADRTLLENYWSEACSMVTASVKSYIKHVSDNEVSHSVSLEKNYEVTLSLSELFDNSLENSIKSSLFHSFVYFIVSKWCIVASPQSAESYALEATKMLNDAVQNLCHRKRPERP